MSGKDLAEKIADAKDQLHRTVFNNSGDDLAGGVASVVEELMDIITFQQDTINWLQKEIENVNSTFRERSLP